MTSARIGSARGEALRHVMYRFGVFCGALTEAWQAHLVTVCCTPPFTVLVERGRGRFHYFFGFPRGCVAISHMRKAAEAVYEVR